jgi:hypothetical protein
MQGNPLQNSHYTGLGKKWAYFGRAAETVILLITTAAALFTDPLPDLDV